MIVVVTEFLVPKGSIPMIVHPPEKGHSHVIGFRMDFLTVQCLC
jgi:hypothetical protein